MHLSKTRYRAILKQLDLSQRGCGRLFDLTPLTGQRWAANGVDGPAAILLELLAKKVISIADIEKLK